MRKWLFRSTVACVLALVPAFAAWSSSVAIERLRAQLIRAYPRFAQAVLRPSVVPGLYDVRLGTHIYHVSADGRYLLSGDVVDLATRTNLTAVQRAAGRVRLLQQIAPQSMIVIAPPQPTRTITVFTDVDCFYCARLHRDVPELNRRGVAVRYLLFPRDGLGSVNYWRNVAVWCAPHRRQAIAAAFAHKHIVMRSCLNPVRLDLALGERLGVDGTPTIFLDDGTRIPGYVPLPALLAALDVPDGPPKRLP